MIVDEGRPGFIVFAVDLLSKVVVDVGGHHYGITDLYNAAGEDTDNPSEVAFIQGVMPNGEWFVIDITRMKEETFQ